MSTAVAYTEVEQGVTDDEQSLEVLGKMHHVILLNDEDHTYEYVVEMLMELFAFGEEKAYDHTVEVDTKGHTRLVTLPLEQAEKKRDQIHEYGPDPRLERSFGAMAALIEPAD